MTGAERIKELLAQDATEYVPLSELLADFRSIPGATEWIDSFFATETEESLK